jgi:hypothetical protein
MLFALPQPIVAQRVTSREENWFSDSPIYYVAWRSCKTHPWRSEEYACRFQAHSRYFALLDRGTEAYVEKRQPVTSQPTTKYSFCE